MKLILTVDAYEWREGSREMTLHVPDEQADRLREQLGGSKYDGADHKGRHGADCPAFTESGEVR